MARIRGNGQESGNRLFQLYLAEGFLNLKTAEVKQDWPSEAHYPHTLYLKKTRRGPDPPLLLAIPAPGSASLSPSTAAPLSSLPVAPQAEGEDEGPGGTPWLERGGGADPWDGRGGGGECLVVQGGEWAKLRRPESGFPRAGACGHRCRCAGPGEGLDALDCS